MTGARRGRSGRSRGGRRPGRAQTETLGFVFVFTLIVLTVGIATGFGLTGLEDAQAAERTNNMERAFEVLDDNVDDISREGAPSRATEIKLSGGGIGINGSTEVRINATNTTDPTDNVSTSVTATPITYDEGETAVSYAAGAVIRSDDGVSRMRLRPDWVVDDRRAVLPLVVTVRTGQRSAIGGSTTVLVVTERRQNVLDARLVAGSGTDVEVNVTVDSPRAGAWAAYFESTGMTAVDADATDGQVTYQFTTDALYVPRVSIGAKLEQ